jgi:TonB family protein
MSQSCFSRLSPLLLSAMLASTGWGQSGVRPRGEKQYGVNFTLALYQYDETRSHEIDPEIRLPQTFDSPATEFDFLKRTYNLEDLMVRHIRSVGLLKGEQFQEGAHLGDVNVMITMAARTISATSATLEVKITDDKTTLLEKPELKLQNFETLALKGGRGRFGLRTFAGPEGPEHVPDQRTLLVTATAVLVPDIQLRDRPREISHPTDQYGREIILNQGDVYLPPIVLRRVSPRSVIRRDIRATVLMEAIVTADGDVTNIRVLQTFDPAFNERAIDAFKEYKVLPAKLNGQPVYATLREEISFQAAP